MGLAEAFRVIKGTSHTYLVTVTKEENISDSNPEGRVDLTLATIYYRWKKHIQCLEDPVLSKVSTTVTQIEKLTQSGDTLGQAKVYLDPADTLSVEARAYVYDVWVQESGGARHAVIEPSDITLEDSVTTLATPAP